jgi:hypothetical protein
MIVRCPAPKLWISCALLALNNSTELVKLRDNFIPGGSRTRFNPLEPGVDELARKSERRLAV